MSDLPPRSWFQIGSAVVAAAATYYGYQALFNNNNSNSRNDRRRRSRRREHAASPDSRDASLSPTSSMGPTASLRSDASSTVTITERDRSISPGKKRIQITELHVYPIKGCRGFSPQSAVLGKSGFIHDREWAILKKSSKTGKYEVCAQDRFPKLKRAKAEIVGKSGQEMLKVTAPSVLPNDPLMVPILREEELMQQQQQEGSSSLLEVDLWTVKGKVMEESPAAHRWFSTVMETEDVVLVRLVSPREPKTSEIHQGTPCVSSDRTNMHDYCTLHLLTEEGIHWLNSKVSDPTVVVKAEAFRPNLVVSGVTFPLEDNWKRFSVGGIPMRVGKLSGRCVTPTTDEVGRRNPTFEPTATLRKYRSAYHRHQVETDMPDRNICYMFGLDVFHDAEGEIRVGDTIAVLETQPVQVGFSGA